jgi:hypothetical protein
MLNDDAGSKMEDGLEADVSSRDWLALARTCWDQSESFVQSELQKPWERALDHFHGRHPSGSKYNSDDYRGRSKLFRPKTRSTIRKGEAACAAAFFSTQDVVSVTAVDDGDPVQIASAEVMQRVLQHRLTKSIPWFLIVQSQFQTAKTMGYCVSRQEWLYERVIETVQQQVMDPMTGAPVLDAETGEPIAIDVPMETVRKDIPVIKPIPPENFRFHQGADFLNPAEDSPFIIEREAVYAGALKGNAGSKDGAIQWLDVDDATMAEAKVDTTSSVREKRSGYDPLDPDGTSESIEDHELVWRHRNIIRDEDGTDWFFYSLGTVALLSEPVPLRDAFPVLRDGERPYVIGYGQLEAFTATPTSQATLLGDLQVAVNDVQNLRMDGLKHSLHPKTRIKAGQQIDIKAATSGAPGSAVVVKDPATDIVYDRPPDVTSTAYAEQDRLNVDFDELAGAFSQGTVATNRRMNETVGGMALLTNAANAVTEYDLRIFAETWVEPVLRQLIRLEQRYESDDVILGLAMRQSETLQNLQRYGVSPDLDRLLDQELTVTVNVGIGQTDPNMRLQKFQTAMGALMQIGMGLAQMMGGPQVLQSPAFQAIAKEIFGAAGYKDASRFLAFQDQGQDPTQAAVQQVQMQAQQAIQQLQAQMAEMQKAIEDKNADRQLRAWEKTVDVQAAMSRQERELAAKIALERQKMTVDAAMKREDREANAALEIEKLNRQQEIAQTDTLDETVMTMLSAALQPPAPVRAAAPRQVI